LEAPKPGFCTLDIRLKLHGSDWLQE